MLEPCVCVKKEELSNLVFLIHHSHKTGFANPHDPNDRDQSQPKDLFSRIQVCRAWNNDFTPSFLREGCSDLDHCAIIHNHVASRQSKHFRPPERCLLTDLYYLSARFLQRGCPEPIHINRTHFSETPTGWWAADTRQCNRDWLSQNTGSRRTRPKFDV